MLTFRYGKAAMSFPLLLDNLLLSSRRGNLTECGMISQTYNDNVHPSKLGQLLLADLMVRYLAKAQAHVESNPGEKFEPRCVS